VAAAKALTPMVKHAHGGKVDEVKPRD